MSLSSFILHISPPLIHCSFIPGVIKKESDQVRRAFCVVFSVCLWMNADVPFSPNYSLFRAGSPLLSWSQSLFLCSINHIPERRSASPSSSPHSFYANESPAQNGVLLGISCVWRARTLARRLFGACGNIQATFPSSTTAVGEN